MTATAAGELRAGDVVEMTTGAVVVLRREETHGGVEFLVRPQAGRGGNGTGTTPRVLWFWGSETVVVTGREDGLCDACCSPGRVGRAEAARESARRRRAAQNERRSGGGR